MNTWKQKKRITFKIKTGYYLELLMSETIKLLGSIEIKITKDNNDKNLPHLETTEVIFVYYNIANNYCQQDMICIHFFPNKLSG